MVIPYYQSWDFEELCLTLYDGICRELWGKIFLPHRCRILIRSGGSAGFRLRILRRRLTSFLFCQLKKTSHIFLLQRQTETPFYVHGGVYAYPWPFPYIPISIMVLWGPLFNRYMSPRGLRMSLSPVGRQCEGRELEDREISSASHVFVHEH